MKKLVAVLLIFPMLLFCGCRGGDQGNIHELTRCDWAAEREGGATLRLEFDGDYASLTLENGGEKRVIEGKMLADEERFVIFDESVAQNYAFSYVPRGEKLDLSYNGSTVELHKI